MKEFMKIALASFVGAFVALGAFCIVSIIWFAGMVAVSAASGSNEEELPSEFVLLVDLESPIGERSIDDPFAGMGGSFSYMNFSMGGNQLGIRDAVQAIKAAAEDPAVKYLYIKANDVMYSMPNMEAIRDALSEFRLSGKPVISYANNYTQASYYIASVSDKVYVNDQTFFPMTGIGQSIFFFKDLLDKLGLQVECIRHGKFKAAAEQFVENHISESNLLQNKRMMESIWESWSEEICKSRGISKDTLNMLVDNLQISDAQSMVDASLADEKVTNVEILEKVREFFGVEDEDDVKTVTLAAYAKEAEKKREKSKDKIAVLYAEGEIVMKGNGLAATGIIPEIRKIAADSSVKAVVLRVNSPGGDAQAAEAIRNELQRMRKDKPLICSFGEYAASGGYWIAAQSDAIFTQKTTLTGSIGVFSLLFNYGNALKKSLDINTESFGTHKHSVLMTMAEPLDAVEREYMQKMVEDVYSEFVGIVSNGRGMTPEKVDSLAQGRVWTGADAVTCNLADRIGTLDDAIEFAAQAAGLAKYKVVEYPKVKNSLDKLMESFNNANASVKGRMLSTLAFGLVTGYDFVPAHTYLLPEEFRAIEEAYSTLAQTKSAKIYARVPYIYDIKY